MTGYPLEYMAADEWNNMTREKRRIILGKLSISTTYEADKWSELPMRFRMRLWGFIAGRETKRLMDDLE